MKKYFRNLRTMLNLMSIDLFGPIAGMHLKTLKADLALNHAIEEARIQFEAHDVRYMVIPTPEGVLRVINAAQGRQMIKDGYFPRSWKVTDIYKIAVYYTDASKNPKHGHALESFGNKQLYYQWWNMTHRSFSDRMVRKLFDCITWISDLIHNR